MTQNLYIPTKIRVTPLSIINIITLSSLYGGVRFFGVAGGPPLIGYFMEKSVIWTFCIPAILAGTAAIFNLLFLKQEVLKKQE
ncbi:MAG: hypothetical protein CVU87_10300 [Firmicutes bacterium HGW-Firmicutes-12]|nr:MAG: hypothetical protein CVU87_10300 [Firmicutes bacterium HGW-Firmicutes-12]